MQRDKLWVLSIQTVESVQHNVVLDTFGGASSYQQSFIFLLLVQKPYDKNGFALFVTGANIADSEKTGFFLLIQAIINECGTCKADSVVAPYLTYSVW